MIFRNVCNSLIIFIGMENMHWISVEHELPDEYQFVLVYAITKDVNEPNSMAIARLISSFKENDWDILSKYPDRSGIGACEDLEWPINENEITHWMPLPNPPTIFVD